jgi:hypothetical protein
MGKNRFRECLGGQRTKEKIWKLKGLFLKTNTPTLQYSNTPADYYWQSLLSLTGPEGPGFPCQNE